MNSFWKCLWSEVLKLRRTLTFWMVLLAPLVLQLLCFGMWLIRDMNSYTSDGETIWQNYFFNLQTFWIVLMLPLFIALETALLASVEHNSGLWKHLYALPVPRGSFYAAKWAIGVIVVVLASLMMLAETYLAGLILDLVTNKYAFMQAAFPFKLMSKVFLSAAACSVLMVSIHTWISQHFHNFTVNVGIGMAAAVANIMIIQSDKPWLKFFPWVIQSQVIEDMMVSIPAALAIGAGGGLLVALIGGWLVTRRDVV